MTEGTRVLVYQYAGDRYAQVPSDPILPSEGHSHIFLLKIVSLLTHTWVSLGIGIEKDDLSYL